jgi:hypothetical protein
MRGTVKPSTSMEHLTPEDKNTAFLRNVLNSPLHPHNDKASNLKIRKRLLLYLGFVIILKKKVDHESI